MARQKQSAGKNRKHAAAKSRRAAAARRSHAGEKPRLVGAAAEGAQEWRRQAAKTERAGEEVATRLQEAAQLWSEIAQDAMRQNVEAAQDLMRCRSVVDVVEVQGNWMRRSLDTVLNRGERLSELSKEIAGETMARFRGNAAFGVEQPGRAAERMRA